MGKKGPSSSSSSSGGAGGGKGQAAAAGAAEPPASEGGPRKRPPKGHRQRGAGAVMVDKGAWRWVYMVCVLCVWGYVGVCTLSPPPPKKNMTHHKIHHHQKKKTKGPIERGGVVVQSWQRVPSTLLQEHCQREKRPRPSYRWVGVDWGVYQMLCACVCFGLRGVVDVFTGGCVCVCLFVCFFGGRGFIEAILCSGVCGVWADA